MSPTPSCPFYDAAGAAKFFGLKGASAPKTVELWARSGKLQGGKAGREWRFTEQQLRNCLAAGGR